jgi:hypothetical protein
MGQPLPALGAGAQQLLARGAEAALELRDEDQRVVGECSDVESSLACIIGARRAWTVEMISSVSMPCR